MANLLYDCRNKSVVDAFEEARRGILTFRTLPRMLPFICPVVQIDRRPDRVKNSRRNAGRARHNRRSNENVNSLRNRTKRARRRKSPFSLPSLYGRRLSRMTRLLENRIPEKEKKKKKKSNSYRSANR